MMYDVGYYTFESEIQNQIIICIDILIYYTIQYDTVATILFICTRLVSLSHSLTIRFRRALIHHTWQPRNSEGSPSAVAQIYGSEDSNSMSQILELKKT